jgi:sentrin-specific protease 1
MARLCVATNGRGEKIAGRGTLSPVCCPCSRSLSGALDPPIGDELRFPPQHPPAMGALTDSQKRLSADHRLPFPPFPPPSPPPPSKRPKLVLFPSFHPTPPTPPPARIPCAAATAASTSSAAPGPFSTLSTTDSAPLRHRRRLPPHPRPVHGPQRILRAFRLGPARPQSAPSWFSPPPRSLGLEQYVQLLNSVSQPPPPIPDAARKVEAAPVEVVTVEEDGDERKEQDDEVDEVVRGSVAVRRVPLYKELYEACQA